MTFDPHRPDPGFVDRLAARIEADDRRLAAFAPAPRRPRRSARALRTLLVAAVLIASVGVVAAGKLDDAERKRLLLDRARVLLSTAEQKKERLAESLGEAKRAYEAGFVGKSVVEREAVRVQLAEVAIQRRRLDVVEIEATGRAAREDGAAPLVGERDLVGERLQLDLKAVGLRIGAAKAERRRDLGAAASGVVPGRMLDETRIRFEEQARESDQKAALVRQTFDRQLENAGTSASAFEVEFEDARNKLRTLTEKLDPLSTELELRQVRRKKVDALRRSILGLLAPDLFEYGAGPEIEELKTSLAKARQELGRLRTQLGASNAKVVELNSRIEFLRMELRDSLLTILDRWNSETSTMESTVKVLAEKKAAAMADFRRLSSVKVQCDRLLEEGERYEAEAARYRRLLEKLQTAPARPQEEVVDADPGQPAERLELEAAEFRRRLAIRAEFLDGKIDAATAALREDRSAAQRRLDEAELGLQAARATLERVKRLHSMGLATRSELREAEGAVLDLEAEARVAKIDVAITR